MSCSDIPGMNVESVKFVKYNLMLDLDELQVNFFIFNFEYNLFYVFLYCFINIYY